MREATFSSKREIDSENRRAFSFGDWTFVVEDPSLNRDDGKSVFVEINGNFMETSGQL